MYWLAGLLIIAIGTRDAYVGHYKTPKNPFIGPEHPIMQRYLFPMVWVLLGIGMIISGIYVP